MGFYLRKSISFGPLRFNLSKSGIGVSAGVRGARAGLGPTGTYVHAGRHGFYYRKSISGTADSSSRPYEGHPHEYFNEKNREESAKTRGDDIHHSRASKVSELLNELNSKASVPTYWFFYLLGAVAGSVLIPLFLTGSVNELLRSVNYRGMAVGITYLVSLSICITIGIVLTKRAYLADVVRRTTTIYYELEPEMGARLKRIQGALRTLAHSDRLQERRQTFYTNDLKRNAGAGQVADLRYVAMKKAPPELVATNVDVWSIQALGLCLYFFPDQIIVRYSGIYSAISYNDFNVDLQLINFVEESGVPTDTEVIGTTWRYQNVDGSPDRRFSNNRQLPIVKYAELRLHSPSKLEMVLQCSNVKYAKYFWSVLDRDRDFVQDFEEKDGVGFEKGRLSIELIAAYETMGVKPDTPFDQINSAYRDLMKQYHPDKVAHLAPEFVEIAERRVREIISAFGAIKRHRGT